MRRTGILVILLGLVLTASGATAQPSAAQKCRTMYLLRFKGNLYFQHTLRMRRPSLGNAQGIALRRACDDTVEPGEPPEPWIPLRIHSLEGIPTGAALAPSRAQVVYYDPYKCSPRLGEARFLRCLYRR